MKNINIFLKLTLLTVALLSILCVSVSAAEFILTDDFEKYDADYAMPTEKYHVGGTNNVFIENQRDNKIAKITYNQKDGKAGRILYEITGIPEKTIVLSYDFMLADPANSDVELFRVENTNGKIEAFKIFTSGNVVYVKDTNTRLISNVEADKWYNIQLYIDFTNKNFDVRSGENVFEDLPFTVNVDNIDRLLSIMNKKNNALYVDNIDVAYLDGTPAETAIFEAKALYVSANTGYADGQYPQSAVERLKDIYNEAYKKFVAGDESDELAASLNDAIEVFKNSRIDVSSVDATPNHIMVTADDILMVGNEGLTYDLNEKISLCDKAGNIIDEQLTYTVESPVDGVTVVDGIINAVHGSTGYLKIKAESSSGIYTRFETRIVSYGTITITECIAYDRAISVKGTINKSNEFPITVTIKPRSLVYTQSDAYFEDTFEFTAEYNSTRPPVSAEFTLKFEGNDIYTFEKTYQFYGDGWRDAAIAEFNAAENDATATGIKALLEKYNFELNISKTLWDTYSDAIISYVYKSKTFADYDALKTAIKEIEYIIAHKDASRENIEEVLADNMDVLVANGFNKAAFDSLTATNKTQFYLNALDVAIDLQTTTVAGICTQLNEMVDALNTPAVRPNRPVTGGGSGGSGGGGGSSYVPKYEISPVATEKPVTVEPETEKEELPETEAFADIADAEWAKDALMYMKAKDIMVGYNNEVRPNDNVTRGECAKILVVAFGLELEGEGRTFADSADAWWAPYASIASTNNVVNGYEDGSFGGDDIITREMLATMIDRIITAKGIELYDKNTDSSFADNEEISDYAAEAVAKLYKKGIINGVGNNLFAPKLAVTRAEAAKMVYSVLTEK